MFVNTLTFVTSNQEHVMSHCSRVVTDTSNTRHNFPLHLFALSLLVPTLTLAAAPSVNAEIIISEIFYNLDGSEGTGTEWVELYNTSTGSIDLTGYTFEDIQDGDATMPFPASSIPGNGTAIVVEQSDAVFESIWGPNINVITATDFPSLANSASATNENLAIKDDLGVTLDSVNYENGTNDWPSGSPEGASIYLLPGFFNALENDNGVNWARSMIGVDGGREALIVNPGIANADALDVASPGFASVPESSSLALFVIAFLVLLGVRPRRKYCHELEPRAEMDENATAR